jgi:four helix bundle protein
MSNFRELKVWNRSRAFVREVYRVSSSFPRSELFGLTQQMRRAAVAIPSNVAEGHGRWSRRDCVHFLVIARGSAAEVETQLFLAEDLNFLRREVAESLRNEAVEISRMLNGLIKYYLRLPEH